jgi:hypothetical protein
MSSGMEYWRTARTNRIRVHFTLPDVA